MNLEKTITSYDIQSNGQVEVCITFVKCIVGGSVYSICEMHSQKCHDTNNDVNLALVWIR